MKETENLKLKLPELQDPVRVDDINYNTHQLDTEVAAAKTHIASRENPHGVTAEQVGAAPAGFGYGEEMTTISTSGSTESAAEFGAKVDVILADMPPERVAKQILVSAPWAYGYGYYIGILYKYDPQNAVLIGLSSQNSITAFCWRFAKQNGAWMVPQWVNPPLKPGVEYLTTEEYNEKPVYTKALEFELTNGDNGYAVVSKTDIITPLSITGSLTKPVGGSGLGDVICFGRWLGNGADIIPYFYRSDKTTVAGCTSTIEGTFKKYTVKIIVRYTKEA